MAASTELKRVCDKVAKLEKKRQSSDLVFKEISDWILPDRGLWLNQSETLDNALERGKRIINPAGTLSVDRAAGGMTTGLTPEGLPWISLKHPDPQVMEAPGVRGYLAIVEDMFYRYFRRCGFYDEIHVFNRELEGFANSLLFMDNSARTLMRFEQITIGTYAFSLTDEGLLDTVCRRFRWPVQVVARRYGEDKLTDASQQLLKRDPYADVDLVHLVEPNDAMRPGKLDASGMAYSSIIYEDKANVDTKPSDILHKSGYHEMPYMYAYWSRPSSSDWAVGPGHQLLGHVKQLQEMERQKLIAEQKMTSPAMLTPSSFKDRLMTGPNAKNAVAASDAAAMRALYEVNVPLQYLIQDIEKTEARIAAVAKADLFYDMPMEMRPRDMTATEYMQRKRERLQQVAPTISVYETNVLDQVITRGFGMFDRAGLLPPPPQALMEAGMLEVEYNSTIAKSLRQVSAESSQAFLAEVGAIADLHARAGVRFDAIHKINFPQALDEIATGVGAPASIIRDDQEYEAIIEEQKQAEAQMAQTQMENEAMATAAKVGSVPTNGTVAGEMMGRKQ